MIDLKLLTEAATIHAKYQTQGVYTEELESTIAKIQKYIDSLPTSGEEPSEEEKDFINKLYAIQLNLIQDKGMMNDGYILKSETPGFRLHFYSKDSETEADDSDPFSLRDASVIKKVLCARLESIA